MIPTCGRRLTFMDGGVERPKTSAVPVPCNNKLCQRSMMSGGVGVELASQLLHNKDLFVLLMTFLNAVTKTSRGGGDRFFGSFPIVSIGDDSFGGSRKGEPCRATRDYARIAKAVEAMPHFDELCAAAAHGETELRRLLTSRDQLVS